MDYNCTAFTYKAMQIQDDLFVVHSNWVATSGVTLSLKIYLIA